MTKKIAFRPLAQRAQFLQAKPLHPLCEIFPWMTADQFNELVADIRSNRQQHPILLLRGQIIDGKNRELACLMAGVEPIYQEYNGTQAATELAISLNWHRRHLSESQRAMIAAKLWPLLATEIQQDKSQLVTFRKFAKNVKTEAKTKAANLMNVSPRSVHDAEIVKTQGTQEMNAAVTSGQMTVSAAVRQLKIPEPAESLVGFPSYVEREIKKIEQKAREVQRPICGNIDQIFLEWDKTRAEELVSEYEKLVMLLTAEKKMLSYRLKRVNKSISCIKENIELTLGGQQPLLGVFKTPEKPNWGKVLHWETRPSAKTKAS